MTSPVLAALIQSIVTTYAARRIVLFGSHAQCTAGADSDIDLVVVLDDDVPPETVSWRRLHEARKGYDGSVDMIPCRERVLTERARAAGSFADTIIKRGVTVYERR